MALSFFKRVNFEVLTIADTSCETDSNRLFDVQTTEDMEEHIAAYVKRT
jgi:hypothetical protein